MRAVSLIIFAVLLGCKYQHPNPINVTGEALASAAVRSDDALAHVQAAIPESSKIGQVHLESAKQDLILQKTDFKNARTALLDEAKDKQSWVDRYFKLDGRWYVWLGRRIQLTLIILGTLYTALGITGAVLGPTTLGLNIFRALPLAQPWVWLRRRLHPTVQFVQA